jgi:glycine/D-amino acid oxidase-like deaminating enzyme
MPSDTTNALLAAARAQGARLLQDCAVTGMTVTGDRIVGVQTTQGEFSAPILVNAAGACRQDQ